MRVEGCGWASKHMDQGINSKNSAGHLNPLTAGFILKILNS